MLNNPILQFFQEHMTAILYSGYAVLFLVIIVLEYLIPRRLPTQSRFKRWASNLSVYVLDMVMLQAITTMSLTNLAYFTWKNHWGLLNYLPLSPLSQFVVSLFLLDLQGYALHVLYHKVPYGWRVHQVHHLDQDMDVSTAVLFHPLESLASFIFRQPFILLIGPSPLAVPLFDVFTLVALFATHTNIRFHPILNRLLPFLFVTPDIHRVHHSTDWGESNSNYGFLILWWDRLFRTYRPKPGRTPETMELGLAEYQQGQNLNLMRLLILPFVKKRSSGPK